MLLNQWMMPTNKSACDMGKKRIMTGSIMVDNPNPVRVPTKAAIIVRRVMYTISIS